MDVFEAIQTLLAVREYKDQAIPRESMTRILEAGQPAGLGLYRRDRAGDVAAAG